MDSFSRDDLQALLANGRTPRVSIFMRTARGPGHEDKVRWKDQLRTAEERLVARGHRTPEANDLLSPARGLLDDVPFWQNVSAGLAGFLSPETVRFYRLPMAFEEQVVVADRFHITPLLPLLAEDEADRERSAALYHQLAGTGRTAKDLAEVVSAAYQGHIQYLFVARGREHWGTFDPAGQKVQVHERPEPGDEELLNFAAVHTLAHKGKVYVVELEQVPDRTPVAALFWLPLGERSRQRVL